MSEMEELKRNAEVSKLKQQFETMNAYIREVSDELDYAWRKEHQSWNVYMLCWAIWVGCMMLKYTLGSPWGLLADDIGFFIFLGGWFYTFYWGRELSRAGGKYKGMMKTLYILGYIDWDIDEPRNRKRLKEGAWDKGIAMVKGWVEKAKSLKGKAYAPA